MELLKIDELLLLDTFVKFEDVLAFVEFWVLVVVFVGDVVEFVLLFEAVLVLFVDYVV